jgi:uncharacterized BrkB/YihY/UPF0761 family membrane protein
LIIPILFLLGIVSLVGSFFAFYKSFDSAFDPENDNWWITPLAILLMFLAIVLFITTAILSENVTVDACEEVDGTYKVIGEEWSISLKQTIDIYGCVKE